MGIPLPADSKQRRRVRNKLSAQAFRKRKQDTLATAKQEVANYDAEINKLRMQLYDVSWIMSVYSIRIDMNHHNILSKLSLCNNCVFWDYISKRNVLKTIQPEK